MFQSISVAYVCVCVCGTHMIFIHFILFYLFFTLRRFICRKFNGQTHTPLVLLMLLLVAVFFLLFLFRTKKSLNSTLTNRSDQEQAKQNETNCERQTGAIKTETTHINGVFNKKFHVVFCVCVCPRVFLLLRFLFGPSKCSIFISFASFLLRFLLSHILSLVLWL